MSTTTFQVIFNGKTGTSLSENEIDVRDLSAALASFGELFEAADDVLNQGRTDHVLKVKGSFKTGSFKIDFKSSQSIVEKVKDIFESQSIVSAESVGQYIIFGGGAYSLIKLLTWLKGRIPTKIIENEDGSFQVFSGGKYIKAEKKVIQLYQNYRVRKAMQMTLSETLSENGVSEISFTKDDGKTFETITSKEASYFISPLEPKNEIDNQSFETNIHLVRISFKEGNKWTVNDGSSSYLVVVEDKKFLDDIEKNKIRFSKGDRLKVRMRFVQYLTSSGLKKEYFIEEVLSHTEASPFDQIELNVEDES